MRVHVRSPNECFRTKWTFVHFLPWNYSIFHQQIQSSHKIPIRHHFYMKDFCTTRMDFWKSINNINCRTKVHEMMWCSFYDIDHLPVWVAMWSWQKENRCFYLSFVAFKFIHKRKVFTFNATAALNDLLHRLHLWLLSTWTFRMWQAIAAAFGAILSQMVHFSGVPMWMVSMCFFKRYLLINDASHTVQSYRSVRLRVPFAVFTIWWTVCMWLFTADRETKSRPQYSQMTRFMLPSLLCMSLTWKSSDWIAE